MSVALNKISKAILAVLGLSLLVFVAFFVTTGFDELWNGHSLWLYGIGMACLLTSVGLSAVWLAFSKSDKAPNALFLAVLGSLVVIFLGVLKF
jgi:hypothetical protein